MVTPSGELDYTSPDQPCDHVVGGTDGEAIAYCDTGEHLDAEILANWQQTIAPSILAYALACAKRGFYVFPCWWIEDGKCACGQTDCNPGKHPIGTAAPRGVLDASVYPETITRWWTRYPKANLALACGRSKLILVDIDPRHGGDESAFWQKVGQSLETVRTLTPGGGVHLWFVAPAGEFTVSVGKFLPGVDIRAGHGYVMLPPSNHVAGTRYDFEVGYSPKDAGIAPCPLILAEHARIKHLNGSGPTAAEATGNDEADRAGEAAFNLLKTLHGVPEGERDDAIMRAASAFRGAGTSKKLAIQLLSEAALRCEPPFPVHKVVKKINDAYRKYKPNGDQSGVELPYTQDWIALRFTEKHGDDLRYTDDWGHWHVWSEHVWRRDNTINVYDMIRDLCREFSTALGQTKTKHELSAATTIAAVERMAKADREHAAEITLWDAHTEWLNMPGSLLEMDKDTARENKREDYLTKSTAVPVNFDMPTPLWDKLLLQVLPDEEMRLYLQRIAGYCLTGLVNEHALFFFYGLGANGKTTILNAFVSIMGDYATTTSSDILLVSKSGDRHPTEIAALQGARLVVANEIERGRTWDEAKIADLTGGGRLQARFMRQDFFEFWPQFKLVISGNHKPSLRGVTEAMRRRFHLLPFEVTIPEADRDPYLGKRLEAEWPGILAWMVNGARLWRRDGLKPPPAAKLATDDYLAKEDMLKGWIEECCSLGGEFAGSSSSLFESWKKWATLNNEYVGSHKSFAQSLEEHGFKRAHGMFGTRFSGIAVKDSQDEQSF